MRQLPFLVALALSTLFIACGAEDDPSKQCEGKCDGFDLPDSEVPSTPCDGVLTDKSGRGLGRGKIAGRLNDPIANMVFKTDGGCPTTFQDIMAKLVEKSQANAGTDATACTVDGFGRRTMLVSETAQALGEPTSYRGVTKIDCQQTFTEEPNRDGSGGQETTAEAGIFFSSFGIPAGAPSLPRGVEIIAFDASQGVFNYYETSGSSLNFFGTSKDMLKGTGSGDDRRCAACHTGGGLVMKELAAPWLHWEGDTTTPGAQELVDAHTDLLGQKSDGIDMEQLVRDGNRRWNETRLEHLLAIGDTKEILRPLFCNVQVNIENGSSSPQTTDHGEVSFFNLTGDIVNNKLGGFPSLNGDPEDYDSLIRANRQRISGLPTGHIETHFGLARVVVGEEDQDYIEQLIGKGVVDREFVEDVLAVDMTRAVFSSDRCGLLGSIPSVPVTELNAVSLRQAILDKLGTPAAGTPAAELVNNLANPRDDIQERVNAFAAACTARMEQRIEITFEKDGQSQTREVPVALIDYMKIISLNREQARRLSVFEFPQTMPADSQNVAAGTRLHPETCAITSQFVALAEPFDPESSCFGRCGEVSPGGCSCAPDCEATGDCCSDFTDECVIPACEHDLCVEGVALNSKCQDMSNFPGEACVRSVCEQDSFCCDDSWDATCVGHVSDICGLACPAPQECCRLCQAGRACGDSCIPVDAVCDQAPGCACDAGGGDGGG